MTRNRAEAHPFQGWVQADESPETATLRLAGVGLCSKSRPRNQIGSRSGSSSSHTDHSTASIGGQNRWRVSWFRFVRGPHRTPTRHWRRSATTAQNGWIEGQAKITAPTRLLRPSTAKAAEGKVDGTARVASIETVEANPCVRTCAVRKGRMRALQGDTQAYHSRRGTDAERTNPVRPRRFAAGRKLPPSDGLRRPPLSRWST